MTNSAELAAAQAPSRAKQPAARTMRIGRLAQLTGRSAHTIRWYEAQRLIPGVRRDPQGRRVYVDEHVGWLDLLERLRSSGMSIRALRDYAALAKRGAANIPGCQALLRAHGLRIEESIGRLQASLRIVEAKIAFYEQWRTTGVRPPPHVDGRRGARTSGR